MMPDQAGPTELQAAVFDHPRFDSLFQFFGGAWEK
jgi:hypothetical protein